MNPEIPKSEFNSEKEYNPERYLQLLQPLFADGEIREKINELENTPEAEITEEELAKQRQELEGQLLSEVEYKKLVDATMLQLQEDIAGFHVNNPNTFEAVLSSRKDDVDKAWKAWNESHDLPIYPDGGALRRKDSEGLQKRERASELLKSILKEIASKNGWEIGFSDFGLTQRMEQNIYVSDGKRTVSIEPTLFKISDRSVVGFNEEFAQKIGLSHLRKNADIRPGKNLDRTSYNFLAPPTFALEDGWPDIQRMPTKEEIEFLEKVIAAYY